MPVRDGIVLSSRPLPVPFFDDREMPAELVPPFGRATLTESEVADIDRALAAILAKDTGDRFTAADQVLAHCHSVLANVAREMGRKGLDVEMLAITDPQHIWRHIRPRRISLTMGPNDVLAAFECDCEWEKERGLALVYRGGAELVYVGSKDALHSA